MPVGTLEELDEMQPVFESAAELFGVLSSPQRLRILRAICEGERSVNEVVDLTHASQPNVSQNLSLMYQQGLVAKRRIGSQTYYRIASTMVIELCRIVCTEIAIQQALGSPHEAIAKSPRRAKHPTSTGRSAG